MTKKGSAVANICTPRRGWLLGLAVAISLTALSVPEARATLFPGKGPEFKVVGGKLTQSFDYITFNKSWDPYGDQCWEYHYHSKGSGSATLWPAGGKVDIKYRDGVFALRDLRYSGEVTRQTSINMKGPLQGPSYDPDFCDPPDGWPAMETFGCGTGAVERYRTLDLLPYNKAVAFPYLDEPAPRDARLGLWGEIPQPLDLYPCPSESIFASWFAGFTGFRAVSNKTIEDLADAKKTVTLSGGFKYDGREYFAHFGSSDQNNGSQIATVNWSLKLKPIPPS